MVIYVIDTGTSMRIFVHTYSITCSERISKKLRYFLSIQIAFFFTGFHLGNKFPRIPARLLKVKIERQIFDIPGEDGTTEWCQPVSGKLYGEIK